MFLDLASRALVCKVKPIRACYLLLLNEGAGPLLHAAAKTICRSIRAQDKITFPIGRILLRTGSRIPQKGKQSKDIIIDPFKAFGKEFVGKRMLPTVPFFERLLFNVKAFDPERLAAKYSDEK